MHIDRPIGHFDALAGTLPRFRVVTEGSRLTFGALFVLCGGAPIAVEVGERDQARIPSEWRGASEPVRSLPLRRRVDMFWVGVIARRPFVQHRVRRQGR